MDFQKINLLVSNNSDLMAKAGNIVSTVFSKNRTQILHIDDNKNETVEDDLRKFKEELEKKGIIPPNSDLKLSDVYEKIVHPVRMNITK